MPWLVLLALALGACFLAGFAVRARAQEENGGAVTVERMSHASNVEIERMLRDVETRPLPELKMGAMCYKPAAPAPVTEYVCPACGEKSLYPTENDPWRTPVNDLELLRRNVADAATAAASHGATVSLDETQFCRKCLPDFADSPKAIIVVRLPDESENRTATSSVRDLWILRDFFGGKNVLVGGNESESPLKGCLPRLRELLGLEK